MEKLKDTKKEYKEEEIIEDDDIMEIRKKRTEKEKYGYGKNIRNDFNKLKKYKIYFYLKLNKDSFIFQVQSDFLNVSKQYVYELIKNIVKKINNEIIIINFNSNNYIVSLRDIDDDDNTDFYIKNYELKPCKKKNFVPKEDCPSFSPFSLLKYIENENISFICKNSINIMLREKHDTYDEEIQTKYHN